MPIVSMGRVFSHVAAAEGKVYCTFASPVALLRAPREDKP